MRKWNCSENKAKSLVFFRENGLIDKAFCAVPSRGGHGQKMDTVPVYLIGARFSEIIGN